MNKLLTVPRRLLLVIGALGLTAMTGWGSFAYVAVSSREQVTSLTMERDKAVAGRQLLAEKSGELAELEAKASSARAEHSRAIQGLAEARAKTASAQQELASLARRADGGSDRVSQTGSIRQPEPPKRPVR